MLKIHSLLFNLLNNKRRKKRRKKRKKRRKNNHNHHNNKNKKNQRKKPKLKKKKKRNQRKQHVNSILYHHQHSILMIGRDNSQHQKIMLLNSNTSGQPLMHKDGLFGLLNILKLKVKEKFLSVSETIAMVSYKDVIHTSRNGLSLSMVFMVMFQNLKLAELGFGEELKFHNIWYQIIFINLERSPNFRIFEPRQT